MCDILLNALNSDFSAKLTCLVVVDFSNTHLIKKYVQRNHSAITQNSRNSIDKLLTKSWELEVIPKAKVLSHQEKACENHFYANVSKLPTDYPQAGSM